MLKIRKEHEDSVEGKKNLETSTDFGFNVTTTAESKNTQDIPPVAPPSKWDYEADIAIIGGGGSGLAAAARALDNGKTVVVIEKMPTTGGLSQHSGASATFNTKVGTRINGTVWNEETRKQVLALGLSNSGYTVDPKLLAMQIDRAHEVFDWAEEKGWTHWTTLTAAGIPDQGVSRVVVKDFNSAHNRVGMDKFNAGGAEYLMGNKPFIDWLAKFVLDNGGKILLNTPTQALVKDGDKVVGVQAQNAEGKTVYVKGNKAVILAGGGFTNNRNMLKKYIARAYEGVGSTWNPPLDTGEVIRMAFGAGADIAGEGGFMAYHGGNPILGH